MQTDPTACHSLIGSLAALLRCHGAAPTGLRGRAGQVPFGDVEQSHLAGAWLPRAAIRSVGRLKACFFCYP
jgi:hypothetical protein